MPDQIKSATGLDIVNQAFTFVVGADIEIFGAGAGQLAAVPGRVALEIQNRNGANIELGTTAGAAAGRLLTDGEACAWDIDSDEWQGNIYVLGGAPGPVQLCVTQLSQAE